MRRVAQFIMCNSATRCHARCRRCCAGDARGGQRSMTSANLSSPSATTINSLGEPRLVSRFTHTVSDELRIPERIEIGAEPGLSFELAGPRARMFFDPARTRAAIVTCGGLCPGLNNVVRSAFFELHYSYR